MGKEQGFLTVMSASASVLPGRQAPRSSSDGQNWSWGSSAWPAVAMETCWELWARVTMSRLLYATYRGSRKPHVTLTYTRLRVLCRSFINAMVALPPQLGRTLSGRGLVDQETAFQSWEWPRTPLDGAEASYAYTKAEIYPPERRDTCRLGTVCFKMSLRAEESWRFHLFERFHLFSHVPVTGHRSIVTQLYCLYLTETQKNNHLNTFVFLNIGFWCGFNDQSIFSFSNLAFL